MIFVEDQHIKLNGIVLPGLVKSIEVKESAKIDEQDVEGSSSKPKQATGYEDAKVNIELTIDDTPTHTKYERLAVLRQIFRKPGQGVPQPIPIVCVSTAKHGIDKVLFKSLSHKDESKKEQLSVTIELWEYVSQTVTARKSTGKTTNKASGKNSGSTAKSGGAASGLTEDYKGYLGSKRGKSPAVDDASPSAAAARRK